MKWCLEHHLAVSQAQELLSLWNWGEPPSQHRDVFSYSETLQSLYHWGFYGGFNLKEWLIINSISRASPDLHLDIYRGSI